jgi:hypothetical protein
MSTNKESFDIDAAIDAVAAMTDEDPTKLDGNPEAPEQAFASFFEEAPEFFRIIEAITKHVTHHLDIALTIPEPELQKQLNELQHASGKDFWPYLKRSEILLTKYQEQPNLLDPHLENMVTPLIAESRKAMARLEEYNITVDTASRERLSSISWSLHPHYRLLYLITKVRGYKTVGMYIISYLLFPTLDNATPHNLTCLAFFHNSEILLTRSCRLGTRIEPNPHHIKELVPLGIPLHSSPLALPDRYDPL